MSHDWWCQGELIATDEDGFILKRCWCDVVGTENEVKLESTRLSVTRSLFDEYLEWWNNEVLDVEKR